MNGISSNAVSEQCILIQQQQSSVTDEQLNTFFQTINENQTVITHDGVLNDIIAAFNCVNKRVISESSDLRYSTRLFDKSSIRKTRN
jgi:hypothetical protein